MENKQDEVTAICAACGVRIGEDESLCPECDRALAGSKLAWTDESTYCSNNLLTAGKSNDK